MKRYQMINEDSSWQLDEAYVKVKGKWLYLYRAINKHGQTLDFYFSHKRNRHSAYQFLKRCLRYYPLEKQPQTLNTDKHPSYGYAIDRLKKEGKLRQDVQQRQVKHLESDHAPIMKLIVATGEFKCRKRAWSTIQGFTSLRMFKWLRTNEPKTLARERSAFINRLFNIEVIFN